MIKYAVKYLKNTFVPLKINEEISDLDGKLLIVRTEKGEEVLKAFRVNSEISKQFENSSKKSEEFVLIRVATQEDLMI